MMLKKDSLATHIISYAVLSERFSFWGLQATLVLFLIQVYSQTEVNAFALVGAFGAMSYTLSLIGGVLADKLLGIWKSCLFGIALCLLGNTILFVAQNYLIFNLGLSCVLVGAGLFSPNSNNLVRMLYDKKSELKESAFIIVCIAGNISGTLAPLMYGIFGAKGLWQDAFLVSVILNFFSLGYFLKHSKFFFRKCGSQIEQIQDGWLGEFLIISLIAVSLLTLLYINWLNTFFFIAIIPAIFVAAMIFQKLYSNEKQHVVFLLVLTTILLLFYTAVFQIYSSMTIFIAAYVNREIFGWAIPVPAFASLQCIFFILFAPIVEKILVFMRNNGYNPSLLVRIPIGLGMGAIGFIMFAGGELVALTYGNCESGWIVGGNMFLGLGEVLLYPPILSVIATFSPKRWAGTFMGVFSISLAFSSYFSGQLAKLITRAWVPQKNIGNSILNLGYARITICLIIIIILTSMIFFYIGGWYNDQKILIEKNT